MKAPLLIAALSAAALSVPAAPVCQLGTLADYVALGSSGCTINDKLFANFIAVHTASGTGAVAATSETIAVAPIVETGAGILDPGPGILFASGDWTAFAGQSINTSIRFTVTALDPRYSIASTSLSFSGAAIGSTGAATITETVLTGMGGFGLFVGDLPGTGDDVFSDIQAYPMSKTVTVLKDIQVKAGTSSFAKISFHEQPFSQVVVPEPGAASLVGGALLAVALLRRR